MRIERGKLFFCLAMIPALLARQSVTPTPAADADKPVPVSLRELSSSLQQLTGKVRNAVVQIFATGYAAPKEDSDGTTTSSLLSKQQSTGSGVILSADGYIVTNSHVVRGARRIEVRLAMPNPDAALKRAGKQEVRIVPAQVIGMDRETDLAVIKIERANLPVLSLANSDEVQQGQLAMAFGNPLGLEGSVSMGIVSSTSRQIKPDDSMAYIQTDAPINPGNSGGPLVDSEGRVIGINTFILSQSGGSEGIGFAIPSNIVANVYRQIRKEGHVHRGMIGLYAQTVTTQLAAGLQLPRDWGVLVGDAEPDGPAAKAGIVPGDIILNLNGRTMTDARQLEWTVYRYPEGDKIKLEILRDGEKLPLEVPVIERRDDPERFADMVTPEANLVPRLGLLCIAIDKKLAELLPDLRRSYGVVVAAGSAIDPASGTGLRPGDVIYTVNGSPISSVPALRKKLDEFKSGDSPVLQIERSGRLMYVAIELE